MNSIHIFVFYLQLVPVTQLARDKFEKYLSCYSVSENTTALFDKRFSKY